MKKIWLAIIGLAVVVLSLAGLTACSSGSSTATPGNVTVSPSSQQTGLWVNGEGKIEVVPDVAVIQLGIEAQELAVADAQAEASTAMAAVIAALKAQGIDNKDIQTQYFSINQVTNWNNNKEEITGYRVDNTVTVKVRNVDGTGTVIDAVVAAGGNFTRVNGINFTKENPAEDFAKARALAITTATAKAQAMADKAGIKLGKITYISESTNNNIVYRNYVSMSDAGMAVPTVTVATPVSVGQLELTADVQIAYEIK